jgi:pimeloyl-ACP methyl ester carboxylesterase
MVLADPPALRRHAGAGSRPSPATQRAVGHALRHEYFRTHRPPLLAVWGQNDPFFLPAGAEAFKRDIPDAVVRFFDTGHFALETHAADIAAAIREFLAH